MLQVTETISILHSMSRNSNSKVRISDFFEILLQQSMRIKACLLLLLVALNSLGQGRPNKPVITYVTCLYDIGRGNLSTFKRSFQYYLDFFEKLLKTPTNIIIYGESSLKSFVDERRNPENTVFVEQPVQKFQSRWFAASLEELRQEFMSNPMNQRVRKEPQFLLPDYNRIMFNKIFMVQQAMLRHDKWGTDFFLWFDGGGVHVFGEVVSQAEDKVARFAQFTQRPVFFNTFNAPNMYMNFPQGTTTYTDKYVDLSKCVLGTSMAFSKEAVTTFRTAFQNLLKWTLVNKDFNSDESVFTLMIYRFPYLVSTYGGWPVVDNVWTQPLAYSFTQGTFRKYSFNPQKQEKGEPLPVRQPDPQPVQAVEEDTAALLERQKMIQDYNDLSKAYIKISMQLNEREVYLRQALLKRVIEFTALLAVLFYTHIYVNRQGQAVSRSRAVSAVRVKNHINFFEESTSNRAPINQTQSSIVID